MKLQELKQEQLTELKQRYLTEHTPAVSYEELANADDLVTMEQLTAEYGGTEFVPEDFATTDLTPDRPTYEPTDEELDRWFHSLDLEQLERIYNDHFGDANDFIDWCDDTWCETPREERLRIYHDVAYDGEDDQQITFYVWDNLYPKRTGEGFSGYLWASRNEIEKLAYRGGFLRFNYEPYSDEREDVKYMTVQELIKLTA